MSIETNQAAVNLVRRLVVSYLHRLSGNNPEAITALEPRPVMGHNRYAIRITGVSTYDTGSLMEILGRIFPPECSCNVRMIQEDDGYHMDIVYTPPTPQQQQWAPNHGQPGAAAPPPPFSPQSKTTVGTLALLVLLMAMIGGMAMFFRANPEIWTAAVSTTSSSFSFSSPPPPTAAAAAAGQHFGWAGPEIPLADQERSN